MLIVAVGVVLAHKIKGLCLTIRVLVLLTQDLLLCAKCFKCVIQGFFWLCFVGGQFEQRLRIRREQLS